MISSMSRRGDCQDNAVAKRVLATLKSELMDRKPFESWRRPRTAIFEYIEVFYNRRHRHSSLQYATPHDYDLARTPRSLATAGN